MRRIATGVIILYVTLLLLSVIGIILAISWADRPPGPPDPFLGSKGGDERAIAGVRLCWCPAGWFPMGSHLDEPKRRPDEEQVAVILTKGFWMTKYEVTQGQWKRVVGKLPGPLTAELPEGDAYPVCTVNFAEAESFCQKLTTLG